MQAGAGVEMHAKPGDRVRGGEPLFTLHTDEPDRFARAVEALAGAVIDRSGRLPARPARPGPRPGRLTSRSAVPQLIAAPTRIPVPGGKVIDEYVGRVTSGDQRRLGGAHAGAGRAGPSRPRRRSSTRSRSCCAARSWSSTTAARSTSAPAGGAHPGRRAGALPGRRRGRGVRRGLPAGVRPRPGPPRPRRPDAGPGRRLAGARSAVAEAERVGDAAARSARPAGRWRWSARPRSARRRRGSRRSSPGPGRSR